MSAISDEMKICNVQIKINSDGLFCLNDIHKASGGAEEHSPWRYVRLEKVQELEAEILKHQKWAIKKDAGRYGGTYVCKQLVYAYAMWISPSFHLSVINYLDKHSLVESKLDALVNNVHTLGDNLIGQLDSVSLSIDDMNSHGSNWGSYGVATRMAKKECRESLENLRDQIQLKLDLDN